MIIELQAGDKLTDLAFLIEELLDLVPEYLDSDKDRLKNQIFDVLESMVVIDDV